MTAKNSDIPLVARAFQHPSSTALIDAHGSLTYNELLEASAQVAANLLGEATDLLEQRVAFLVSPGSQWVAVQWGIWRAGGVAVPLAVGATRPEIEYCIDDAEASIVVSEDGVSPLPEQIATERGLRHLSTRHLLNGRTCDLPEVDTRRSAMMLYTSGTTSKPKGVVTTHNNIRAQVTSLIEAWEWTSADRTVLCLPLHHVHGIINVVSCAMWAGAACFMMPRFNALAVWDSIANDRLTVFMAVPTIYIRLIAAWEAASADQRAAWSAACGRLRLMVSGSAALPVSTLERWREISGHTLLERYGMTEIGMALSNPLHGPRIPGAVGLPLPGVDVQLTSEDGTLVGDDLPGEIEVRGETVFSEYWRRPEATRDAFRDGWFRTGDTAVRENGIYRILGRTNVDILKSGGHKISALEIEEALRLHPCINECAVVGIPDAEWGQRVAVVVVLHPSHSITLADLRTWGREHMAAHKLPSRLLIVEGLPRNAMGKVVKPAVTALFTTEDNNDAS